MTWLVSVARNINNKINLQERSRKDTCKKSYSIKKKEIKRVIRVVKGGDNLLDNLFRSA